MKKRKKKALKELEDVRETLHTLLTETAKSGCGRGAAIAECDRQIEVIRKGIVKK